MPHQFKAPKSVTHHLSFPSLLSSLRKQGPHAESIKNTSLTVIPAQAGMTLKIKLRVLRVFAVKILLAP